MKLLVSLSLLVTCFMFSGSTFAEGEVSKIIKTEEKKQTTKKRSRRKKVEMCVDCGKPETECDCPGYVHGAKDEDGEVDGDAEEKK